MNRPRGWQGIFDLNGRATWHHLEFKASNLAST